MAGMMSPAVEQKIRPGAAILANPNEPEQQHQDEPESNVTPEEQKQYDDFVSDGLLLIYEGGKVRPTILEMLDDDPADLKAILGEAEELKDFTPSVALAATAVVIVLELVRRGGDKRPDDAVIMHGGKELLEELADLAGEAGTHDFTQEELNKAWFLGLDLYRDSAEKEGLLDTSQLKEEFAEIQAADAEGRLGDVFGGAAGQAPEPAIAEGGDNELRR